MFVLALGFYLVAAKIWRPGFGCLLLKLLQLCCLNFAALLFAYVLPGWKLKKNLLEVKKTMAGS